MDSLPIISLSHLWVDIDMEYGWLIHLSIYSYIHIYTLRTPIIPHVMVVGSGFLDTPFLSCRFAAASGEGGQQTTPALYLSPTAIRCVTPSVASLIPQGR